jgi:hypothetical protein
MYFPCTAVSNKSDVIQLLCNFYWTHHTKSKKTHFRSRYREKVVIDWVVLLHRYKWNKTVNVGAVPAVCWWPMSAETEGNVTVQWSNDIRTRLDFSVMRTCERWSVQNNYQNLCVFKYVIMKLRIKMQNFVRNPKNSFQIRDILSSHHPRKTFSGNKRRPVAFCYFLSEV